MLKVALVDDEEHALDFLEILLNEIGNVEISGKYTDPMKAIEKIDQGDLDAVFLDIDMPKVLGMELAGMIRKKNQDVAIVFVTAYEQYAISAFEHEALDYLLKPVDVGRLKNTVRRMRRKRDGGNQGNRKFIHEGLEIDYQNYEIRKQGIEIALSAKEKQLLMYMVANPNQVFSLDALYSQVWGSESNGDTRTVMVHISNLRKKIEDNPLDPQMIKTVRGFGYMFEVNVDKPR